MKKIYKKPDIIFEDFALVTSIATCEITISNQSKDTCAYEVTDEVRPGITAVYKIFDEQMTRICDTYPQDGVYDGFCYHNPSESYNLFIS